MASFEHLKVLVADDNQNMRAIVVEVLKSVGVRQIRECRDGEEALKYLSDFAPDVAIVDFRMSPIDGVEFTRKVRGDESNSSQFLPIIMLTAYADRGRVMEARDAGVSELIVKPVTAKAVITRLNAVIFHPRQFVRAESYFGPDRRRILGPGYQGPERRTTKAEG